MVVWMPGRRSCQWMTAAEAAMASGEPLDGQPPSMLMFIM